MRSLDWKHTNLFYSFLSIVVPLTLEMLNECPINLTSKELLNLLLGDTFLYSWCVFVHLGAM